MQDQEEIKVIELYNSGRTTAEICTIIEKPLDQILQVLTSWYFISVRYR